MKLYDFSTGSTRDLPVPPEIRMLNHPVFGKVSQYLFLNDIVGKMAGFIFCNSTASSLLHFLGIARGINEKVDQTYAENSYPTLNHAFTHRYDHPAYPIGIPEPEEGYFITSPVSAYLSIRDIEAGEAEFFPGVRISIPRMLGTDESRFHTGTLMVFTLKPHHDHTIDFPTASEVVADPQEINREKLRVDSTDLSYIRTNARQSVMDENHRVVTLLSSRLLDERYALVEVGANIVNSIQQDYDPEHPYHKRGTQKSHFNFGSTVILVLPEPFMSKVKILDDIDDNAHRFDRTCEVKRGTVIMVDRNIKSGTYGVAEGVDLRISNEGSRITETRMEAVSEHI